MRDSMRKINIVTDSTSDLSDELLKKFDIKVWPLYINFGEESFRDKVDIGAELLYKKVEEYGELPKTAALSPLKFHELFSEYSKDEDVIYMGIGSQLSVNFNNARLAAEEFDNVYLADSNNLSTGIGLQLLKMAKYRDEGLTAQEIVEKIKEVTPKVSTRFAINTLEYLHKGGRCSSTSKFFGTALNMKPIIKVIDGKMLAAKKPIGFKKALNAMVSEALADKDNIDLDYIMITHSLADKDAIYLKKKLESNGFTNIYITKASGVISTHCGPRTIGILYILKN